MTRETGMGMGNHIVQALDLGFVGISFNTTNTMTTTKSTIPMITFHIIATTFTFNSVIYLKKERKTIALGNT